MLFLYSEDFKLKKTLLKMHNIEDNVIINLIKRLHPHMCFEIEK